MVICKTNDIDNFHLESNVTNFTGTYKLVQNINYNKFLSLQGFSWTERKIIDSLELQHVLNHEPSNNFIQIKMVGLITVKNDYIIGGEPIETNIKNKTFYDTVCMIDNKCLQIKKVNIKDKYHIITERRMSLCGNNIIMEQTITMDDGTNKSEKATQIFKRLKI